MTELKGVVSDSFSHLQFYNGQNLVNSSSFSITMGLICFLTWYNFVNMSRLVLNQQMTLNPRMWFDMILQIHVSKLFLNHKVSWLPLHKLNKWHRTTKMHLDMILSYLVIRENEIWTCLVCLISRLKLLNDEIIIYYLRKILDPTLIKIFLKISTS